MKTIVERADELVDGIIADAGLPRRLRIPMRARVILALKKQDEITLHAAVERVKECEQPEPGRVRFYEVIGAITNTKEA